MPPRRRKRPTPRANSPPLHPQLLTSRNLYLLPVSLGDLPTDASFVDPLRKDVHQLLTSFALTWPAATDTVSPFQRFTQCWNHHGWDYVHFGYPDHPDTARRFCSSIARVLLEHLPQVTGDLIDDQAHAKRAVGVLFGLFILWDSQYFPTSGVGSAYCRRAWETIPIEADILDILVRLPSLCRHILEPATSQPSTSTSSNECSRATADVVFIVHRLCGHAPDPIIAAATASAKAKAAKQSTPQPSLLLAWRVDAATVSAWKTRGELSPIVDVLPPSCYRTRLPRVFPSSVLTTRLQADRSLVRLGRMGDVALSRGDLIRLRARERLGLVHSLIEIPSWVANDKVRYRMRPWLDTSSSRLETALERLTDDRDAYRTARNAVIQDRDEDVPATILDQFNRHGGVPTLGADAETDRIDSETTLDRSQIYQLAARATSAAISAARETVERRSLVRPRVGGNPTL